MIERCLFFKLGDLTQILICFVSFALHIILLQEHGEAAAFMCSELDKVASEVEKVENWLSQCHVILEPVFGNLGSLTSGLVQVCFVSNLSCN